MSILFPQRIVDIIRQYEERLEAPAELMDGSDFQETNVQTMQYVAGRVSERLVQMGRPLPPTTETLTTSDAFVAGQIVERWVWAEKLDRSPVKIRIPVGVPEPQ